MSLNPKTISLKIRHRSKNCSVMEAKEQDVVNGRTGNDGGSRKDDSMNNGDDWHKCDSSNNGDSWNNGETSNNCDGGDRSNNGDGGDRSNNGGGGDRSNNGDNGERSNNGEKWNNGDNSNNGDSSLNTDDKDNAEMECIPDANQLKTTSTTQNLKFSICNILQLSDHKDVTQTKEGRCLWLLFLHFTFHEHTRQGWLHKVQHRVFVIHIVTREYFI